MRPLSACGRVLGDSPSGVGPGRAGGDAPTGLARRHLVGRPLQGLAVERPDVDVAEQSEGMAAFEEGVAQAHAELVAEVDHERAVAVGHELTPVEGERTIQVAPAQAACNSEASTATVRDRR